jgi:hypothetical protein
MALAMLLGVHVLIFQLHLPRISALASQNIAPKAKQVNLFHE